MPKNHSQPLSWLCLTASAFLVALAGTSAFVVPDKSIKNFRGAWGVMDYSGRHVLNMSSNQVSEDKRKSGGSNFNKNRGGAQGGRRNNNGPRRQGNNGGRQFRPNNNSRPGFSLRLENPLKVQRKPAPVQERTNDRDGERNHSRNNNAGNRGNQNNNDRTNRPAAAASMNTRTREFPSGGTTGLNAPRNADKGPGRNFNGNKKAKKNEKNYDKGRSSLRMTTSKKGRAASASMKRGSLKKRDRSREKEAKEERALERRTVTLTGEAMTVSDLAEVLDEKPVAVIKFLMTDLGIMAAMTQLLDPATCIAVTEGMGKVVAGSDDDEDDEDYDDEDYDDDDETESALDIGFALEEEDPDSLVTRPPVVTIMGHVDHGKTSLLDTIRNTRVVAGEAGGITQHIGAYQIQKGDQKITFIDTPGHAAFTDMRQRGANITDVVILVVAADDGVKQQTADSLLCARQAGVPIVVAVNKIDLPTANVDRVLSDLTAYDVLTETLGGDVLCQEVSAKESTNIDELLEKVLLQAEILDLKANPDREAQGAVVEANVEKGLGSVAVTLIQKGTLKVGDVFVAGSTYGRVKALFATDGTRIDEAGPSTPVKVVGFNACPGAGDILVVCDSEQQARDLAENRNRIQREKESAAYQAGLRESVAATFAGGKIKELREMCVVLKADVQGSAEALARSLSELKLEDDEAIVTVKVLVSEAGEVTKSDVAIASVTPGSTIIAFNCAANYAASEDARQQNIPIEYYSIVYDAIESVECRMQEVLSPTPEGEYVGSAIVQEVFNIGGVGNIAGSKCRDGIIRKGSNVRVMRGDKILSESKVKSLRNFKAEVESIQTGDECGVGLLDFEEFEPGDIIESYVEN